MFRDLSSKGIKQGGKRAGFRLWEMHSMFLLSGSLSRGSHLHQTWMGNEVSRQKAVGRRQKAEGRRQKAEGRRQKAVGSRQKAEGSRQVINNQ